MDDAQRAREALAILAAPVESAETSKLPKIPKNADGNKGTCSECGGYHVLSRSVVHLDYMGHAAVTARLLSADPFWSWEPVATDENGLPLLMRNEQGHPVGMWIRLTVAGMTRLGFGSCEPGKPDAVKELIGDAIRNAAMRFGCGLELWHKGDHLPALHDDVPKQKNDANRRPVRTADGARVDTSTGEVIEITQGSGAGVEGEAAPAPDAPPHDKPTPGLLRAYHAAWTRAEFDDEARKALQLAKFGVSSSRNMSREQMMIVMRALDDEDTVEKMRGWVAEHRGDSEPGPSGQTTLEVAGAE